MLQRWKARIQKLPRHHSLEERRRFNRYARSLRAGSVGTGNSSIIGVGRKLETLLRETMICKQDMTLQDYQSALKTTLSHIHNYITQFINIYKLIQTGYTSQIKKEVIGRIGLYKDKQTVLDCYVAWLKEKNISEEEANKTFEDEALEYFRGNFSSNNTPLKKYRILFQYIGFLLFLRDGTNNMEQLRGDAPIVATCMLQYIFDESIAPEQEIKRVFHCLLQKIRSIPRSITEDVEKSLYGLTLLSTMMNHNKTSLEDCIREFLKIDIANLNAVESIRILKRMSIRKPELEQPWVEDKNVYKRR